MKITSLSGVGFILTGGSSKFYKSYKNLLKQNSQYNFYRFADVLDKDKVDIYYFIYDVDTLLYSKLNLLDNHLMDLCDHNTTWMTDSYYSSSVFEEKIKEMEQYFETQVDYYQILTSAGVKKYSYDFMSDRDFTEHYDYPTQNNN